MPVQPTPAEVIRDAITARLEGLSVATVGRVEKYDPVLKTVDVLPLIQHAYNVGGGEVDYETICVLPNVPLLFPRAGGFFMHIPVVKGDTVLLIFCHDSFSNWWASSQVSRPDHLGRHSLGNAIAIPGVVSAVEGPIDGESPAMDLTEAVLGGGVYRVGGKLAAKPVAIAEYVEAQLAALKSAITAAVPTAGDGGAAFKTQLIATLADWPASVGASKLKAE